MTADEVLGVVLAGGAGARLGGAKAAAPLAGRPLVSYPVEALSAALSQVVVMAKPDSELPPDLAAEVWLEPGDPRHPLAGIVEALRRWEGPALVCGCDMPFISAELVRWTAALEAQLSVAAPGGLLQPLFGRYGAGLLPELERGLDAESPLRTVVGGLDPHRIEEPQLRRFGDPELLFFNVNTPAQLRKAELLIAGPLP